MGISRIKNYFNQNVHKTAFAGFMLVGVVFGVIAPIGNVPKAEAADVILNIPDTPGSAISSTSVTVTIEVSGIQSSNFTSNLISEIAVGIFPNGASIANSDLTGSSQPGKVIPAAQINTGIDTKQTFTVTFSGLTANTGYKLAAFARRKANNSASLGMSNTPTITTDLNDTEDGDTGKTVATGAKPVEPESCVPLPGYNFSMAACVADLLIVIVVPTQWIATLSAKFLDFFIAYSIDSSHYTNEFITEGWGISRDLANMAFIFILLWTAIQTILSVGGAKTKERIGMIIIVALAINFSLFFTKIFIDAGNTIANVFYNRIEVTAPPNTSGEEPVVKGEYKSITQALASGFRPQTILNQTSGATGAEQLLINIAAIGMNILMTFIFLSVAFLFIGRVAGLWIAMIFAPIAFVSAVVPGLSKQKTIGWEDWFSSLTKLAFMAPVFMFFMYIILRFNKILYTLVGHNTEGGASALFNNLLSVFVPFAIIATLLTIAKKKAVEMSGEIGAAMNKYAGMATGAAVGLATGGAALLGQKYIGGRAQRMASDTELQSKAAAGDKGAQRKLALANMVSKSTFDVRKTQLGGVVTKQTGLNFKTPAIRSELLGIDLKTEGGARGKTERDVKAATAKAETYKLKGPEADEQNAKAKAWKSEYDKEFSKSGETNESEFKKKYEAGMVTKANGESSSAKILNASETNARRMRDQADSVQYGRDYVKERDTAKQQAGANYVTAMAAWTAAPLATRGAKPEGFSEDKWRKDNYTPKTGEYQSAQTVARRKAAEAGVVFDEKDWKENTYFKFKDSQFHNSRGDAESVSSLRKSAGEEVKDEKKPLSPREAKKVQDKLDNANNKIQEFDAVLTTIANFNISKGHLPANATGADVTKAEVKNIMDDRETALIGHEARIVARQGSLNNPNLTAQQKAVAQTALATAMRDKKNTEKEIEKMKSVLEDKKKKEEERDELSDKLV
jgi:hypothetical protein